MSFHLIRRDGPFPPGGYPFTDPKTGFKLPGMEGSFNDQVRKIIAHRLANPLKYPLAEPDKLSFDAVANELDTYQCLRLGNNTNFCTDGTLPVGHPARLLAEKFCPACGGRLTYQFCPTCTRSKHTGYICQGCGKMFDLNLK